LGFDVWNQHNGFDVLGHASKERRASGIAPSILGCRLRANSSTAELSIFNSYGTYTDEFVLFGKFMTFVGGKVFVAG